MSEMKIYIGKLGEATSIAEAAAEAGAVEGAIRFGSFRTSSPLVYIGINPPPGEVQAFRLDAPVEGPDRPERWEWSEGSAWYTRDLCAFRVLTTH